MCIDLVETDFALDEDDYIDDTSFGKDGQIGFILQECNQDEL